MRTNGLILTSLKKMAATVRTTIIIPVVDVVEIIVAISRNCFASRRLLLTLGTIKVSKRSARQKTNELMGASVKIAVFRGRYKPKKEVKS